MSPALRGSVESRWGAQTGLRMGYVKTVAVGSGRFGQGMTGRLGRVRFHTGVRHRSDGSFVLGALRSSYSQVLRVKYAT